MLRQAVIAVALVPLLATACASVQPYPRGWAIPALARGDDCPAIDGIFQNYGEREDSSYSPNLTRTLVAGHPAWHHAGRVQLQLIGSSSLSVRVFDGDAFLSTHTFSRALGDFSCEGGVVLFWGGEFVNREGVVASEKTMLSLALAENGFLVIKEERSAVGTMFLVPFAGSSTIWSRYEPWKQR